MVTNDNQVNLEQVCSLNIEQSRLLQLVLVLMNYELRAAHYTEELAAYHFKISARTPWTLDSALYGTQSYDVISGISTWKACRKVRGWTHIKNSNSNSNSLQGQLGQLYGTPSYIYDIVKSRKACRQVDGPISEMCAESRV